MRILPFTTTRKPTRTPATRPATVLPMPRPVTTPSAALPVNADDDADRLTRLAIVLHCAAALAEACPELSPVEAVEEAETMLATDADAAPTPAELTMMVRALFPNAVRH